jgi:hypothetical protein
VNSLTRLASCICWMSLQQSIPQSAGPGSSRLSSRCSGESPDGIQPFVMARQTSRLMLLGKKGTIRLARHQGAQLRRSGQRRPKPAAKGARPSEKDSGTVGILCGRLPCVLDAVTKCGVAEVLPLEAVVPVPTAPRGGVTWQRLSHQSEPSVHNTYKYRSVLSLVLGP